jgi:hypothetical protein
VLWLYDYDTADDAVIGATYNNVNELVSQQPAGALVVAGTLNEAGSVTVAGQPAVETSVHGIAPWMGPAAPC